jgi:small-conductance mechanosensitive channel
VITGGAALAALALAGGDAVLHGGRFTLLAIALAAAALALLFAGLLFRRPFTIPWSVLLVAAAYLVGREGSSVVDGLAAVVGALLLLSAELASWSIEHDARIHTERSLVVRRLAIIGSLVAGALLVDFILLGTAAVSASAGVLLAAVGVAAAVGAVSLVLRLVRA